MLPLVVATVVAAFGSTSTSGPAQGPAARSASVAVLVDDPALAQAASAALGATAIDRDVVKRARNDAARLGLRCAVDEPSCATKVGLLIGAATVIVRRADPDNAFTLLAVDVASGAVLRKSGPWPSAAIAAIATDAVGAVVAPDGGGFLFVRIDERDGSARLIIDGVDVGEVPSARPARVRAGTNIGVDLQRAGFEPFTRQVSVAAGEVLTIFAVLERSPAAVTPDAEPERAPQPAPAPAPEPALEPVDTTARDDDVVPVAFGFGVLGGVAAVVSIVAVVGAVALDATLASPEGTFDERTQTQQNGRALAITGAVSAAIGVGAVATAWVLSDG